MKQYLVCWTQHHNKWVDADSEQQAIELVGEDTHRAPFGVVCSSAPLDVEIQAMDEESDSN